MLTLRPCSLSMQRLVRCLRQACIIILMYLLTSWIVSATLAGNRDQQDHRSKMQQYETTAEKLDEIYSSMILDYFQNSNDKWIDSKTFSENKAAVHAAIEETEKIKTETEKEEERYTSEEKGTPSVEGEKEAKESSIQGGKRIEKRERLEEQGREKKAQTGIEHDRQKPQRMRVKRQAIEVPDGTQPIREEISGEQEIKHGTLLPTILLNHWPSIVKALKSRQRPSYPFQSIADCSVLCDPSALDIKGCKASIKDKIRKYATSKDMMDIHCLLPGLFVPNRTMAIKDALEQKPFHTLRMFKNVSPSNNTKVNHMAKLLAIDRLFDYIDNEVNCKHLDLKDALDIENKVIIAENSISQLYQRVSKNDNNRIISIGVHQKLTEQILFKPTINEVGDLFFYQIDESEQLLSNCNSKICGVCLKSVQIEFTGSCNVTINHMRAGNIQLCSLADKKDKIMYFVNDIMGSLNKEYSTFEKTTINTLGVIKNTIKDFLPNIYHPLKSGEKDEQLIYGVLDARQCVEHQLYRSKDGVTDAKIKCGEILVPIKELHTSDSICHIKFEKRATLHFCKLWPVYRYLLSVVGACVAIFVSYALGILFLVCALLSFLVAGPAYIVFRYTPRLFRCSKCCYPWSPCHECPDMCICGHYFDKNVQHDCPLNALKISLPETTMTKQTENNTYWWDESSILQEDGTYSTGNLIRNPNYKSMSIEEEKILDESETDTKRVFGLKDFDRWIQQTAKEKGKRGRGKYSHQIKPDLKSRFKPYFFYHTFANLRNPYTRSLTIFLYYLLCLYTLSRLIPVSLACPVIPIEKNICTKDCLWEKDTFRSLQGDLCVCRINATCSNGNLTMIASSNLEDNFGEVSTRHILSVRGCPENLPMTIREILQVSIIDRLKQEGKLLQNLAEEFEYTESEIFIKIKECLISYGRNALITILLMPSAHFENYCKQMSLLFSGHAVTGDNSGIPVDSRHRKKMTSFVNPFIDSIRSIKPSHGPLSNEGNLLSVSSYALTHDYMYFISKKSEKSIVSIDFTATLNNAVQFHPIIDGQELPFTMDVWIPEIAYVYKAVKQYKTCPTLTLESTSYSKCWAGCDACVEDAYTLAKSPIRVCKEEGVGLGVKVWPGAQKTGCNARECAGSTGQGCLCVLCTNILDYNGCGTVYSLFPLYLYATICMKAADLEPVCTIIKPGNPLTTDKILASFDSQEAVELIQLSDIVEFVHDPQIYYGKIAKRGTEEHAFGHPQLKDDMSYSFSVDNVKADYECYIWADQKVTVDRCLLDTFNLKSDLIPLQHSLLDEQNSLLYKSAIAAGKIRLQFTLDADDIKVMKRDANLKIESIKCSGCCACTRGLQCQLSIQSDSSTITAVKCLSVACSPDSMTISKGTHGYNVTILTNDCNIIGREVKIGFIGGSGQELAFIKVNLPKMENGMKMFSSRLHSKTAAGGTVPHKGFFLNLPSLFGNTGHWICMIAISTISVLIFIILVITLARYIIGLTLSKIEMQKKTA